MLDCKGSGPFSKVRLVMWLYLVFFVLFIVMVYWVVKTTPSSEILGMNGQKSTICEVRGQVLGELKSRFRSRFPGREFELDLDEYELFVPNENEGIEGLVIVVRSANDLMVATGEFIHWHFEREFVGSDSGGETRNAVVAQIDQVLDHISQIFDDKLYMFSVEGRFGLTSGTYELGNRPGDLDDPKKITKEWAWSGALRI